MARTRNQAAYDAKKSEILRAAEALFVKGGFHQTGIAAICAAVGMSPGALYRYFPSKTEIIRALVEQDQAETALLLDRVHNAKAFQPALVKAIEEALRAVSDPSYGQLALDIAAEGMRNPDVAAILQASEDALVTRLADLIRQAQADGQVAATANASASARIVVTLIDGASGSRVLVGMSKRALRTTLTRMLEGLFGP